MEVKYDPSNWEPSEPTSFRPWRDPRLHQAMRELFGESERENLVEIVIRPAGIHARFVPKAK